MPRWFAGLKVKIAFHEKAEGAAHCGESRVAHAEVAKTECGVEVFSINLDQEPGAGTVRREEFDHGIKIDFVVSARKGACFRPFARSRA